jgi:hypothetical protein
MDNNRNNDSAKTLYASIHMMRSLLRQLTYVSGGICCRHRHHHHHHHHHRHHPSQQQHAITHISNIPDRHADTGRYRTNAPRYRMLVPVLEQIINVPKDQIRTQADLTVRYCSSSSGSDENNHVLHDEGSHEPIISTTTTTGIDTNDASTPIAAPTTATTTTAGRKNTTRQRHKFPSRSSMTSTTSNLQDIPSFHDFQRNMQIRTLYRQYTRLIGLYRSSQNQEKTMKDESITQENNKSTSTTTGSVVAPSPLSHIQRMELQSQVRYAFKQQQRQWSSDTQGKDDTKFYLQKALAEGQRRYQELYLMILGHQQTTNSDITTTIIPFATITTTPLSSSSTTSSSSPDVATDTYWPWNKKM